MARGAVRARWGDSRAARVEHEIEDLSALITEAGGQAHLYGVSTGGALVLEAAAAGLPIGRLAVYDVPYILGEDMLRRWRDYAEQLTAVLGRGQRGEALALFLRLNGASGDDIAGARSSPMWAGAEALAHTLAYDAACLAGGPPPAARLATITQPALVLTGESTPGDRHMSGLPHDLFERAADAIAASVPRASRQTLAGQGHVADPRVAGPVLARFFTSQPPAP